MNPITTLATQFGLKTTVSTDDQFYLSNGTLVTYSTVNSAYTAFYNWMENQLEWIDKRSILTVFNAYVAAKKLSTYNQQLLRAGILTNVEEEYAASMGNLSGAYFDQVGAREHVVLRALTCFQNYIFRHTVPNHYQGRVKNKSLLRRRHTPCPGGPMPILGDNVLGGRYICNLDIHPAPNMFRMMTSMVAMTSCSMTGSAASPRASSAPAPAPPSVSGADQQQATTSTIRYAQLFYRYGRAQSVLLFPNNYLPWCPFSVTARRSPAWITAPLPRSK